MGEILINVIFDFTHFDVIFPIVIIQFESFFAAMFLNNSTSAIVLKLCNIILVVKPEC